jgi:hypothetical protein
MIKNIEYCISNIVSNASPQFEIRSSKSEQGVVSLIASIIIGIMLIIITISGLVLMSAETRQATDFDQSVKAYFAAESGVEDALAEIKRRLDLGDNLTTILAGGTDECDNFLGDPDLSGDTSVSYTCQIVEMAGNELNGVAQAEESFQVDLTGTTFNRLEIHWNQQGIDAGTLSGLPASFPGNAPINNWLDFPAVMELRIISYPTSGAFNANQIESDVVILKPHNSASPPPGLFNVNAPPTNPALKNIVCTSTALGGYNCSIDIPGFSNTRNYIARIKPKYYRGNTHYSIRAFQGGNPASIPNGQLAIDVTAKAGDAFRRVRVQIPVGQQPDSVLDYVILTDEDICKFFSVSQITNTASSETGCDP